MIYRDAEWSSFASNSEGRPSQGGKLRYSRRLPYMTSLGENLGVPTISHIIHGLMSLIPRDLNPLVHPIVDGYGQLRAASFPPPRTIYQRPAMFRPGLVVNTISIADSPSPEI